MGFVSPVVQVLVCGRDRSYSGEQLARLIDEAAGGSVSFVCVEALHLQGARGPAGMSWSPGGIAGVVTRSIPNVPEVAYGTTVHAIAREPESLAEHAFEVDVSEDGDVINYRLLAARPARSDRLEVQVYLPFEP
jgi:hypothetical protein